jgi:hypothetical protein
MMMLWKRREDKVNKFCVAIWLVFWLWAAPLSSDAAEKHPPAKGEALPEITMPAPKDPNHQVYLGLTDKKDFTISDIPAEVVIIEIFNMY